MPVLVCTYIRLEQSFYTPELTWRLKCKIFFIDLDYKVTVSVHWTQVFTDVNHSKKTVSLTTFFKIPNVFLFL